METVFTQQVKYAQRVLANQGLLHAKQTWWRVGERGMLHRDECCDYIQTIHSVKQKCNAVQISALTASDEKHCKHCADIAIFSVKNGARTVERPLQNPAFEEYEAAEDSVIVSEALLTDVVAADTIPKIGASLENLNRIFSSTRAAQQVEDSFISKDVLKTLEDRIVIVKEKTRQKLIQIQNFFVPWAAADLSVLWMRFGLCDINDIGKFGKSRIEAANREWRFARHLDRQHAREKALRAQGSVLGNNAGEAGADWEQFIERVEPEWEALYTTYTQQTQTQILYLPQDILWVNQGNTVEAIKTRNVVRCVLTIFPKCAHLNSGQHNTIGKAGGQLVLLPKLLTTWINFNKDGKMLFADGCNPDELGMVSALWAPNDPQSPYQTLAATVRCVQTV